jgi:hypothetical protein
MLPLLPIIGLGTLISALFSDKCHQPQTITPDEDLEGFGAVPPPPAAMASGASVLRSAGLASPGSWTRRNVLAAGAQSAYARRLSGTATEADFAVLRAARPGIASGVSGPISGAWTGNPWQPSGIWSRISGEISEDDFDAIGEEVAESLV